MTRPRAATSCLMDPTTDSLAAHRCVCAGAFVRCPSNVACRDFTLHPVLVLLITDDSPAATRYIIHRLCDPARGTNCRSMASGA